VAAASYQARRFGIHSAMPMRTALRLCPQLVILPLRMEVYRQLSTQIRQIFFRYTHLVEPVALDECYLDVTDNLQSIPTATQTAMAIKQQIREQMQLTASAGVANNKFLAKIASDMEKPDGLTVIKPRQVEAFLQHLPVNKMWGVGPITNKQLQQMQIQTIGQLRQLSLAELSRQWGKLGVRLYHLARGQDDQAVDPSDDRKSVSRETTFAEDLFSLSRMEQELAELSTEVAEVLRREGLRGRRVTLKVRYPNFQIQTRSQSQANGLEEEQIRQISQGLVACLIGGRRIHYSCAYSTESVGSGRYGHAGSSLSHLAEYPVDFEIEPSLRIRLIQRAFTLGVMRPIGVSNSYQRPCHFTPKLQS